MAATEGSRRGTRASAGGKILGNSSAMMHITGSRKQAARRELVRAGAYAGHSELWISERVVPFPMDPDISTS